MVSFQNLEFELQNLFKEKKFSEIIFEITTKPKIMREPLDYSFYWELVEFLLTREIKIK